MPRETPLPLIVAAAATAVAFWSLKPVFIGFIGDRASYAEVFLVAGGIGVTAGLIGVLFLWRKTLTLLTDRRSIRASGNAAIAGLLLGMWYYGFYRALYGSQKVDATVIAFSWPLIAVIAMRIFLPAHGRALQLREYGLIVVAFFGAISIGVANLDTSGNWAGSDGISVIPFS